MARATESGSHVSDCRSSSDAAFTPRTPPNAFTRSATARTVTKTANFRSESKIH